MCVMCIRICRIFLSVSVSRSFPLLLLLFCSIWMTLSPIAVPGLMLHTQPDCTGWYYVRNVWLFSNLLLIFSLLLLLLYFLLVRPRENLIHMYFMYSIYCTRTSYICKCALIHTRSLTHKHQHGLRCLYMRECIFMVRYDTL